MTYYPQHGDNKIIAKVVKNIKHIYLYIYIGRSEV